LNKTRMISKIHEIGKLEKFATEPEKELDLGNTSCINITYLLLFAYEMANQLLQRKAGRRNLKLS